uniref:Uncharacterized protein n=1 Tax=Timema bartmani TaxID=61472 RepID=A0A7R9FBK1_9NEOP|nr:unnamed protein product [Timema bartmani]
MTRDQISEFLKLVEEFVKRFYEEGPGAVGQDLEQGAKLMEVFWLSSSGEKYGDACCRITPVLVDMAPIVTSLPPDASILSSL